MRSEIEQWFPGCVAPIDYKPHLFNLNTSVVQHDYLIDYGDGCTENTSSQGYRIAFKEPNDAPMYARLNDNTKLIEVLTNIENAIRTNSVQRYALSELELFPSEESEISFDMLENRIRMLYALYLCYRVLIWHNEDERLGKKVTREDLGSAYFPFYWQETESIHLQKMLSKDGKTFTDYKKMPLYERAKLIVQDIAQFYLKNKITVEFSFEEVQVSKNVGGKDRPVKQKKERLVEKYVCDSLFTALLMQIMRYIQLGEEAKHTRQLKICEQCNEPFLPKRSDARYCPKCGSGAKRQERYLKSKNEEAQ